MRLFDLALLLGVIALPSAGAGYVISGPGATAHTGVDPQDFARIDLDGDGQADIELEVTGAYAFVSSAPNSTLDFTADPVENGSVVGSQFTFNVDSIGAYSGRSLSAMYGFRFDSGGMPHYGWADILANPDNGGISTATVDQWAYESEPNTPILVAAAPEPAGAALLLVAAPVLLRRRQGARALAGT